MRYSGPAAIRLKGDEELARMRIPAARLVAGTLLNQLELGGIESGVKRIKLPDGTIITVLLEGNLVPVIFIDARETVVDDCIEVVPDDLSGFAFWQRHTPSFFSNPPTVVLVPQDSGEEFDYLAFYENNEDFPEGDPEFAFIWRKYVNNCTSHLEPFYKTVMHGNVDWKGFYAANGQPERTISWHGPPSRHLLPQSGNFNSKMTYNDDSIGHRPDNTVGGGQGGNFYTDNLPFHYASNRVYEKGRVIGILPADEDHTIGGAALRTIGDDTYLFIVTAELINTQSGPGGSVFTDFPRWADRYRVYRKKYKQSPFPFDFNAGDGMFHSVDNPFGWQQLAEFVMENHANTTEFGEDTQRFTGEPWFFNGDGSKAISIGMFRDHSFVGGGSGIVEWHPIPLEISMGTGGVGSPTIEKLTAEAPSGNSDNYTLTVAADYDNLTIKYMRSKIQNNGSHEWNYEPVSGAFDTTDEVRLANNLSTSDGVIVDLELNSTIAHYVYSESNT